MINKKFVTKHIKSRLYYLLRECSVEEYDTTEVNVLIDALKILEPEALPTPSMHITFCNSVAQTHIHKIQVPPISSNTNKTVVAAMGIAAAACIVSAFLFGANAPIKARPDTGFFFWLNQDNEGMTMITNPQNDDSCCESQKCCTECLCGCTNVR